jgi:hypothetical protein
MQEDEGLLSNMISEQMAEELVHDCCLIRANDSRKNKWDFLIMILAVWNAFTIPVDVAFEPLVSAGFNGRP